MTAELLVMLALLLSAWQPKGLAMLLVLISLG